MNKTLFAALLSVALSPLAAHACDNACKVAAVESYLTALQTHDASLIPLTPTVRRIENNLITADTEAGLRKDLSTSAKFKLILGLRDKQIYVAGDEVFVIYTVDAGIKNWPQLASGRTFERFRVVNGLIDQIEVVVYTSAGKAVQPPWPAP